MPNGFWTDGAFSPRSKNKFLVELFFNDYDSWGSLRQEAWYAKSVTLPSFEIGKEEIKNNIGACQRHVFPRKMTWKPVSLVLVDPIDHRGKKLEGVEVPSADGTLTPARPEFTTQTKANIVHSLVSTLNSALVNDPRIYKGAINVPKQNMNEGFGYIIIKSLNDYGEIIDQWKLNNIILTSMDMGTLSYTDDAPFELSLTFEYEWADYTLDPENRSNEERQIFRG